MADYALTTQGEIRTTELDIQLKAVNGKVQGISVVHYTVPRVVMLHCGSDTLSDLELAELNQVIQQHSAV